VPHRDRERQRAAERRWYLANKDKVAAKKNAKRVRLQAMLREAKEKPCADCGVTYPYYVMDFDHVSGEKLYEVSRLVALGSVSKLVAELAKCDVVCSNCHRERTHRRRLDQQC
jgi:hypothetical protein